MCLPEYVRVFEIVDLFNQFLFHVIDYLTAEHIFYNLLPKRVYN